MRTGLWERQVSETGERNMASRRAFLFAGSAAGVLSPWMFTANADAQATQTSPSASLASPPSFRSDQIALLMQTLRDAETHGFRRDEFLPPDLDGLLRSASAQDRQRGAGMLKASIIAYARAQHGLRLPTSAFQKNWGMRPGPYDAESEFNFALAQDRLSPWLDALPPPFDRYRGLKDALAQYRAIVAQGGWTEIDDGPRLNINSEGSRVRALRARLMAEDPQTNLDAAASIYDQGLYEAVQHFQHNVGLDPTGAVDSATLAALNVPAESRVTTILANMERWRWVPRIWPATRIEANIAGQEMDAFQNNVIALEMRAAPGRPDDQTPILSSQVESVVFDPPWNVPSSIATKELWPKERAHPGYLESHGYRLISTGDGDGQRIQQKWGPKSALGDIKFDFPNDYAVYLHDTPSRRAFGKASRAVSHGCVRLQRPLELANLLFQGDDDWTPDRIDQVIADGKTVRAPLQKPVPIFIMYWTAFLDVKGRVNFRDDVYGWDAALMGLIAAGRNRTLPSPVT
jgi:murein L,D-transpeptidase YcbB/YkuD